MTKIVKLSSHPTTRLGLKRVRKRKKKTPEDFGQLNIFTPKEPTGKLIQLTSINSFEEALNLDEQGDLNGARDAYRGAIQIGDRVGDAYCNLGILESQNNTIKAIDCFTRSLKSSPRHFQSHYNLANLYSEEKNFPLALLHYEIAIEIAPDFPNAYYNLGLVLALMKNYSEAIQILTKYKSLAPADELGKTNELIGSLRMSLVK